MSWLSKFRRTPLGGLAEMIIRQQAMARADKLTGGKISRVSEIVNNPKITGSSEQDAISNVFNIGGTSTQGTSTQGTSTQGGIERWNR